MPITTHLLLYFILSERNVELRQKLGNILQIIRDEHLTPTVRCSLETVVARSVYRQPLASELVVYGSCTSADHLRCHGG